MADSHLESAARALGALDASGLVDTYADEFVFEDIPGGRTITNKDDLIAYFEGLFSMPDVAFSEVDFYGCGQRGAGTWLWTGTDPHGAPYAIRGASIFDLGVHGIRCEMIFYDPRPALD